MSQSEQQIFIDTSKLKINPEYEKLIFRMSKDDDLTFDESIKKNGVLKAIEVNQKNIILDGKERYYKALKYKIKLVPYLVKHFESKLEEKKYIYEVNLKQRHLTPIQKVMLAVPLLEIEQELAKKRSNKNLKNSSIASSDAIEKKGKSAKTVSKDNNLSTSTLERGKTVLKNATKEELDLMITKPETNTINKIYKKIIKRRKIEQVKKTLQKKQINLPDSIQLYNQPFQELKIKDNSVSLIFTDPDYTKKNLHLYKDLAKQAKRVLKDGGSLMCYTGQYCIDTVLEYVKAEGLKYHWIIPVLHSGASALMFSKKIMVGYKPILWFTKGDYDGKHVKDVIKSEFQGKELHEWAQSTVESDYYIKHMTIENEIVYDPFMGQGTFGISANKLNRQFIGAEINKEHFKNAQKLISLPGAKTKEKTSPKQTKSTNKNKKPLNDPDDEPNWIIFPECEKCNPNGKIIYLESVNSKKEKEELHTFCSICWNYHNHVKAKNKYLAFTTNEGKKQHLIKEHTNKGDLKELPYTFDHYFTKKSLKEIDSNKTFHEEKFSKQPKKIKTRIVFNCNFCGTVCKNFVNHLKKYHTAHIKKEKFPKSDTEATKFFTEKEIPI